MRWIAAVIILGAAVALTAITPHEPQSARFPESRSTDWRELWASWDKPAQLGFVRGFIVGHEEGYRLGCRAAAAFLEGADIERSQESCNERQKLHSRDPQYYADAMTDFYSRYPANSDVPFRVLLLALYDEGQTPDTVHDWLNRDD